MRLLDFRLHRLSGHPFEVVHNFLPPLVADPIRVLRPSNPIGCQRNSKMRASSRMEVADLL